MKNKKYTFTEFMILFYINSIFYRLAMYLIEQITLDVFISDIILITTCCIGNSIGFAYIIKKNHLRITS